jgi:hypothetical protein
MSFIHYITIGHLVPEAVARGEIETLVPLSPEVLQLLDSFLDAGSRTLGGSQVLVTDRYVRCVWMGPGVNKQAERFAVAAHAATGCIAADVERRSLVDLREMALRLTSRH